MYDDPAKPGFTNVLVLPQDFCFLPPQEKRSELIYLVFLLLDTEIDWTTYMQQVSQYLAGERDYTAIKGSTGPLVYPAAHVYIYSFLHGLTNEGRDILHGQILFAILYIHALAIVLICYSRARVPPYVLPLLVLSKRLHSIYVLRLFNDGVAAFAMWLSILFFQRDQLTLAVALWSVGVGIKMTLLLLAPGIAVIVALRGSLRSCIQLASLAVLIQVATIHLWDIKNFQQPLTIV